jgi:hypothetical protein
MMSTQDAVLSEGFEGAAVVELDVFFAVGVGTGAGSGFDTAGGGVGASCSNTALSLPLSTGFEPFVGNCLASELGDNPSSSFVALSCCASSSMPGESFSFGFCRARKLAYFHTLQLFRALELDYLPLLPRAELHLHLEPKLELGLELELDI